MSESKKSETTTYRVITDYQTLELLATLLFDWHEKAKDALKALDKYQKNEENTETTSNDEQETFVVTPTTDIDAGIKKLKQLEQDIHHLALEVGEASTMLSADFDDWLIHSITAISKDVVFTEMNHIERFITGVENPLPPELTQQDVNYCHEALARLYTVLTGTPDNPYSPQKTKSKTLWDK